nr:hypothetical protein [uncultured Jannaschia sp.]
MMMPSSITRLVEASRKASEGTSPAPFDSRLRVVASAKEHDEDAKPKKVARATERGPSSEMVRRMRACVTKTWIIAEIR